MISVQFVLQRQDDLLKERTRVTSWIEQKKNALLMEGFEKEDKFCACAVEKENHRMATERLEDVERALEKIVDGSFGICIDCKGEIPEERLLVIPFASRCVPCKRVAVRT